MSEKKGGGVKEGVEQSLLVSTGTNNSTHLSIRAAGSPNKPCQVPIVPI